MGERLSDQGIGVTVVDPVWALPVNPALIALAADHDLVITIEDNGVVGGWGARLAQELRSASVDTPVREFGIPQEFLPHGGRGELLRRDRADAAEHRPVRGRGHRAGATSHSNSRQLGLDPYTTLKISNPGVSHR